MMQTTTLTPEKDTASVSPSDAELVTRARAGDRLAFRELVVRYEGAVAATVCGMLGPGTDAEDVGQEVFVRFFRSLDQYRGEASLRTYLTRIAVNLSLNALKRRRRRWSRINREADLERLVDPSPGLDHEQRDQLDRVRAAITLLPPPFRVVVVLRLVEGYSTRETAELLGVPLGTVLSRLSRAQQKLKTLLKPYFDDEP